MASALTVNQRPAKGKGPARQLRMKGQIPGVVYGHGKNNVHISVDRRVFEKFLEGMRSEAELLSLQLQGESGDRLALIKGLQHHPVTERILHVDFFEVNPEEPVHINVPLHFVGNAFGVVDEGGLLEFIQRNLDVVCLPKDIPSRLDVDIAALKAGEALHIGEIKLPEGVRTNEDPKKAIILVVPKSQGGDEPAAAAPEAGAKKA